MAKGVCQATFHGVLSKIQGAWPGLRKLDREGAVMAVLRGLARQPRFDPYLWIVGSAQLGKPATQFRTPGQWSKVGRTRRREGKRLVPRICHVYEKYGRERCMFLLDVSQTEGEPLAMHGWEEQSMPVGSEGFTDVTRKQLERAAIGDPVKDALLVVLCLRHGGEYRGDGSWKRLAGTDFDMAMHGLAAVHDSIRSVVKRCSFRYVDLTPKHGYAVSAA